MRNLREDIMGNYASAYEEYYRNLNRKAREKDLGNRKNLSNNHGSNNFMTHADDKTRYFTKNYWIKRIERELAGSLFLILCFMGLKYTHIQNIHDFYLWCRGAVVSEFNYDESIEAFNSIEIGDFKARDFRLGTFKIEDLKSENLKSYMENFKEYINQLRAKSI